MVDCNVHDAQPGRRVLCIVWEPGQNGTPGPKAKEAEEGSCRWNTRCIGGRLVDRWHGGSEMRGDPLRSVHMTMVMYTDTLSSRRHDPKATCQKSCSQGRTVSGGKKTKTKKHDKVNPRLQADDVLPYPIRQRVLMVCVEGIPYSWAPSSATGSRTPLPQSGRGAQIKSLIALPT